MELACGLWIASSCPTFWEMILGFSKKYKDVRIGDRGGVVSRASGVDPPPRSDTLLSLTPSIDVWLCL